MYGWLHLVGNDKLDSGRLERVLWIEPDHEVKGLILKKKSRNPISDVEGKGGHDERSIAPQKSSVAVNKHLVQTFSKNLYREIPRLEVISLQ